MSATVARKKAILPDPKKDLCQCGRLPTLYLLPGTSLKMVVCTACKTAGPARRTEVDAIEGWNSGLRYAPGENEI